MDVPLLKKVDALFQIVCHKKYNDCVLEMHRLLSL